MCSCSKNVKVQEYQNQVSLKLPKHMIEYYDNEKESISVDSCIANEIEELWSYGIITTGCCCGHNVKLPFINVDESCVDKMLGLGYHIQINVCGIDNMLRVDAFYPKSVKYTSDKFVKSIEHLIKTSFNEKE